MAINRGPFNALVDDDGSNAIGSKWNKTAIKDVILDPADAAYAPVPSVAAWTPVLTADGGASGVTYATRSGAVVKDGPIVLVQFVINLSSKGTMTGNVQIGGLPYLPAATYMCPLFWDGLASPYAYMLVAYGAGSPTGWIAPVPAGGNANLISSTLPVSALTNASKFWGSFQYHTSS